MPKYSCELFGQIIYAPEISYDDLLPLEEALMALATETLEDQGAQFIHFESEGDRTFFQCIFREFGEDRFSSLARKLAPQADGRIEWKLFFVDKELGGALFYGIEKGKIKANKVTLPAAGPIDTALLAEKKEQEK